MDYGGSDGKKTRTCWCGLGRVSIGFNLGILLGPPVIGAVVDSMGWGAGAIAICVSCIAAAVIVSFVKLYSADDQVKVSSAASDGEFSSVSAAE